MAVLATSSDAPSTSIYHMQTPALSPPSSHSEADLSFPNTSSTLSVNPPPASNLHKRKRESPHEFCYEREVVVAEFLEEDFAVKPWKRKVVEERRQRSKDIWPGRGRTTTRSTQDPALLVDQPITEIPELIDNHNYAMPSNQNLMMPADNPALRLDSPVPPSRNRTASPSKVLKNDLPYATPQVILIPELEEAKKTKEVDYLVEVLFGGMDTGYIPSALQPKLEALGTPIPRTAYDTNGEYSPLDVEHLWRKVAEIHREAAECKKDQKDENAWCQEIVYPVLNWIKKFEMESVPSFIKVQNIQTQAIDGGCVPVLRNGKGLDKKADYALTFSHQHPDLKPTYEILRGLPTQYCFSAMTDAHTSREAVLGGVEVKSESGTNSEAELQLAVFLSAALTMVKGLGEIAGTKIEAMKMPMCGWTVVGHEWKFFIACFDPRDDNVIQIIGPLDDIQRSTKTLAGVFKLLRMVEQVKEAWGKNTYWPWLKGNILDKLA